MGCVRRLNTQCVVTTVDGPTSVAVHDARRLIEAAWSFPTARQGTASRSMRTRGSWAPTPGASGAGMAPRPPGFSSACEPHARQEDQRRQPDCGCEASHRISCPGSARKAQPRFRLYRAKCLVSASQPATFTRRRALRSSDRASSASATATAALPTPTHTSRQVRLTGGSSRDGDPRGFRLRFLGFQAADVENSHRVSGHEAIQNAGCPADRGAGRVRQGRALPACATASAHHPAEASDSAGAEDERAARFQGARA